MKKILFIVNPVSGVGRKNIVVKLIKKQLDKQQFDYRITYTQAPKHATELAHEAAAKNFYAVVAIGGDGTVNEIGKGLVGTQTAMAFLPAGSGNGLARHLKIPINLSKAMSVINSGRIISIDTVNMNNEMYVGMAGIGFDAHIGWKFATFGKRGFWSYVKIFLREYPKYKAQDYEICLDGKTISKNAFLISFANGSQYGNNAAIAPEADLQDGLLDVCVLKNFPLYSVPYLAWRLFNQLMHQSKYMETFRTKEILIKQNSDAAHIDGEPVQLGKELKIKVNPLSLKVIVPQ